MGSPPGVRPPPGAPPLPRAHLGIPFAFAGDPHGAHADHTDPWAPDPVLDGAAIAAEEAAAAEAAAALQESGFGSALHTALTELGRISDDPVPVYAEPLPPSPPPENLARRQAARREGAGAGAPAWPAAEPVPVRSRRRGTPAGWAAAAGHWWTARWRDLLPGIVVAALVVVAFAVVLVSGARHGDTSHLDSRPIPDDPSTTIPGLFTTATVPPGDTPPSVQAAPPATTDSSKAAGSTPTTKASAKDSSAPSAPAPAPAAKQPVAVTPDPGPTAPPDPSPTVTTEVTQPTTTIPHDTTTLPDPPPSVPTDICQLRPTHCGG